MLFQFGGFGFISRLEQLGVFDGLFPFILVYVVVFAILQKTKVLGKDANNQPHNKFNAVVALVMGAAFIYPHYSGKYLLFGMPDPVNVINSAIPQIGIMSIIIILFLILLGLMGIKVTGQDRFRGLQMWMFLFVSIFVGYVFLEAADVFRFNSLWFLNDPNLQFFIVIVVIVIALISFLSSKPREPNAPSGQAKLLDALSELFRGKKLND